MESYKLRDIKQLAKDHRIGKWQRQNLNSVLTAPFITVQLVSALVTGHLGTS